MIDLRNKCVLVRTQEEYEKILKEAEKQGFRWYMKTYMNPIPNQDFPDILKFDYNRTVYRRAFPIGKLLEASELLGTKELTAREFINFIEECNESCHSNCGKCVLNKANTKCGSILCASCYWRGNEEELISIAKSGRITICSKSIEVAESIQDFIDNPDIEVTDEFIDCLKFAVDKLKE